MSLIEANEKIAEKVVGTHKVIEKAVLNGYKATTLYTTFVTNRKINIWCSFTS